MKHLLHLEFRKLRKQRKLIVCTSHMIGLLFLSALTTKVLMNLSPELSSQAGASGITSMTGAVSSSSFVLITGIFVALAACEDYEQQTIKNIYARGYTRTQTYYAKLIAAAAGVTAMFLAVLAFSFTLGTLLFGAGIRDVRFLAVIGTQYIAAMADTALAFAIAAFLRRNGSSIAAIIVAPMIVNMVLSLADSFLRLEDLSLMSLWVSSFMSDLSSVSVSGERLLVCLAGSLLYIPVFAIGGQYLNKRIKL